jgi:succinyl-CoA synthetase alpha subunit
MSILVNKNTKIITQGMTGAIVSPSPSLPSKTFAEVLKG